MSRLTFWGTLLTLLLASNAAPCLVLSGSFSGSAVDSRINATSPTPGSFDGEVVTGAFRLDVPDDYFHSDIFYVALNPPTSAWYVLPAGTVTLSFDAAGQHVEFGDPSGIDMASVTLVNGPDGQQIILSTDINYSYWNADLTLAGPPGVFFEDLDLATLHPGFTSAAGSSAGFFAGRDFGAGVVIDRILLDGFAIPEPPTWGLLLAGLGGWVARTVGGRFRPAIERPD